MPKATAYTALIEYIARTIGHGRTPAIVQDADRRFRINEPPDGWPDLDLQPAPPLDAQTQALIERLETSSHALKDPLRSSIVITSHREECNWSS